MTWWVSHRRPRVPSAVIAHPVWLHHRFVLSLWHVEEMLIARSVQVSYETTR